MPRTPVRREPRTQAPPVAPGSPVEVRLIGHEDDVQRLVIAMQEAVGTSTGPASYRASRYSGSALRAYLTVVIPPAEEQP